MVTLLWFLVALFILLAIFGGVVVHPGLWALVFVAALFALAARGDHHHHV